MKNKMKENDTDCLYLIWKPGTSKRQYVIGKLIKDKQYIFQYTKDIEDALKSGFSLLVPFPDLNKTYYNKDLFPIFSSRLPDRRRKDIECILQKYALDEYDPYLLLKRTGGKLPIDDLYFTDIS